MPCRVELVSNGTRRAVALLRLDGNKHVNINNKFDGLKDSAKFSFKSRFDSWIDGIDLKSWYHGWSSKDHGGKYKNCFQFRYLDDRLYGFLCHPPSHPSFQLCILTTFVKKNEWNTDITHLDRVLVISQDPRVSANISTLKLIEAQNE